jgi:hypothetical protein
MTNIWTESDIKFLVDNYPIKGNKYCAEYLGKSCNSVKTKASRLDLKAPINSSGRSKKTHKQYELELLYAEANFYPIDNYIDYHTAINHSCEEGHIIKISPASVLRGRGCSSCNKTGFNQNIPATLYYISIENIKGAKYYKIGITNETVEKRFFGYKDITIKILYTEYFTEGYAAKSKEQGILKKYEHHRVKVPGFIKRGWTELFDIDILGLDI